MARKRSPPATMPKKKTPQREPSALPPPAPGSRRDQSYMERWRERQASGFDSARWAKLELHLGRFAQGAGLVTGFALWFAAFIASSLSVTPDPPLISSFR